MALIDETDRGAGWITEMTLINFMCHTHTKINFIKHVNFITGQNGSGKSAILTALCVAFGTKAKGTQRATSLKDFIKTGENFASVEVTLCNEGSDAFKPEIYGSLIILERKLTTGGSSLFTLKNYQGTTVSRKREEMEELASHYNIDVENPCVIMTQDKSREFLHSTGSHKDKYNFYLKATLLDFTIATMDETWHMLQLGLDHLQEYKTRHLELEEKAMQLNEKLSSHEEIKRTKERINKWKEVYAWLCVRELDNGIDNLKQEADHVRRNIEAFQSVISKTKSDLEEDNKKAEELSVSAGVAKSRIEEFQSLHRAASEETKKAARERGRLEGEVAAKSGRIRNCEGRIAQLQKLTQQAREKAAHDTEAEESARRAKIAAKESEVEKVTSELERQKEKSAEMERQLEGLKSEQQEIQSRMAQISTKENDCNAWLRRLQEQSGNRLTAFGGQKVLHLLELIERNQDRFANQPIGPVGAYLSLSDDAYGMAVEIAVGNRFDCFAVSCQNDSKILQQLGRQIGFSVTAIIYRFDIPPIQPAPSKVPDPHLLTVEKVLKIDSEIIRNALIDLNSIERIVLVPDYDEGKVIAFTPGTRIAQCIAKDGLRMYLQSGLEVCTKKPHHIRNSRLRKDIEHDKRTAQDEINTCRKEKQGLDMKIQRCRNQQLQFSGPLQESKRSEDQMERFLQKATREHANLKRQADAEAAESAAAVDVQVYLDEIDGLRNEIAELNVVLEKLNSELTEANATFNMCKTRDQELSDKVKKAFEDADGHEYNCSTIQGIMKQRKEEIAGCERSLGEEQTRLEKAISELANLESMQEERKEKARQYCPEPNPSDFENIGSKVEFQKKIIAKEKEIEEYTQRQGGETIQKLTKKRDKYKNELAKRRGTIALMDGRFDLLKQALKKRKATLNAAIRYLKGQLNWYFSQHLSRKGAVGKVLIDDSEKTLKMEIQMPGDDSMVTDTRSLSGGERSFSTLCFALSLHEMVSAPFRAMDEFDVFMDSVTRKICLDEAVHFAIDNASQWIFITPHDISSVEAGEFVTKWEMSAPRN